MAITRQLFQLQEIDTEIEQETGSLHQKQGQLGNRVVLDTAEGNLSNQQKQLDELRHRHRDAEAEVTDVLTKISEIEGQLYGGKITSPKELEGLQHEVTTLKAQAEDRENSTLEIIDQVEESEKVVAKLTADLKNLEDKWHIEQKQLSEEIGEMKKNLAQLSVQREGMAAQLDKSVLDLYERIRKQKNPAVAKVEQGICRVCRISLSASVLQRARGGQPVQCGTCGRILYIS